MHNVRLRLEIDGAIFEGERVIREMPMKPLARLLKRYLSKMAIVQVEQWVARVRDGQADM